MTDPTERAIFLQAIEEENLDDRASYLDSACGENLELRASVESLLAAHDAPATLLDQPIGNGLVSTLSSGTVAPIQHIGMTLGPYRLMEQIGEGGFGLVFVAEQNRPVRRKVALKIVKPGAGSKEVIARFEAERQAVAMMNHPNIAQVFDAGVTADHRPYFVMELVRGLPITEFCDNHKLDIDQRLNLLVDVCSAVHHAHQKGVIHRDIKPSNVMVTLHDDKPVVKVIDFGVAKAIGQTLTDKTIYTRFFSMIGTPLYMSPEQAEMSGLDVDTRSDIYSLGVLSYEMLVGATPFDRDRLDSVGYDELRRIIREEEPPKPSARLSTLGATLSTVAVTRHVQPSRLAMTIRGDLDWIVMKALEKDRSRRYESAAALSADIKRYLQSETIEARPPSRAYQFQKFARRNRAVIFTASLVGVTMLVGTAASLWQMNTAINERNQKEQALNEANAAKLEIEQFAVNVTRANSLIASAQAHVNAGRVDAARTDFDAAVVQQPSYFQPWVARAQFRTGLDQWNEAAEDYARALSLEAPTNTSSWWGTPSLFLLTDRPQDYVQLCEHLDDRLNQSHESPEWELLRECSVTDRYDFSISRQDIASMAERWLAAGDASAFGRPRQGPPNERPGYPNGRPGHPNDRAGHPNERARRPSDRPNDRPGDRPGDRSGDQPGDRPGNRPGPPQPPTLPREVCLYITGVAHVRAGNFQRAIDRLNEARYEGRWPSRFLTHPWLAIAYHDIGDDQSAKVELAKSQDAIDQPAAIDRGDDSRPPVPWFDEVELRLTHAEATRRIDG